MKEIMKFSLALFLVLLCFNLSAQSTEVVIDTSSYPSARFEKQITTNPGLNKENTEKEVLKNSKGEIIFPIERVIFKEDELENH